MQETSQNPFRKAAEFTPIIKLVVTDSGEANKFPLPKNTVLSPGDILILRQNPKNARLWKAMFFRTGPTGQKTTLGSATFQNIDPKGFDPNQGIKGFDIVRVWTPQNIPENPNFASGEVLLIQRRHPKKISLFPVRPRPQAPPSSAPKPQA